MHRAGIYKHLPIKEFVVGQRYQFIENRPAPIAAGEAIGHVEAIDPLTGKPRWRVPLQDHPHWSAMLATGGGLLFTGKETGEFIAIDADSGKTLWQLDRKSTRLNSSHLGIS